MISLIRGVSAVAGLVFVGLFIVTWVAPERVAQGAKFYVQQEIEEQLVERFRLGTPGSLGKKLAALRDRYVAEIKKNEVALREGLAKRIAAVVARLCDLDCDSEVRVAEALDERFKRLIERFKLSIERIDEMIRDRYEHIVSGLLRDVRIFLGATGVVFLLVLLLSVVKHEDRHLLGVPALLLLLTAFAGIYFYVFQQNWFYTIIFDDYWGYGYIALLATILGFLIDIVYLEGRFTRGILSGIAEALSKCGISVG